MTVGQSVPVLIEFIDGGWNTPDIAGAYWAADQPPPQGTPENGSLPAVATVRALATDADGSVKSGAINVDFGSSYGTVEFAGPLLCD